MNLISLLKKKRRNKPEEKRKEVLAYGGFKYISLWNR
jgi:hypothetical protein